MKLKPRIAALFAILLVAIAIFFYAPLIRKEMEINAGNIVYLYRWSPTGLVKYELCLEFVINSMINGKFVSLYMLSLGPAAEAKFTRNYAVLAVGEVKTIQNWTIRARSATPDFDMQIEITSPCFSYTKQPR